MKKSSLFLTASSLVLLAGCASRGAWAYYDHDWDNGYKGYNRPYLWTMPRLVPVLPPQVQPMQPPAPYVPPVAREPLAPVPADRPVDLDRPPPFGRPVN